jgi:hypothetical protein
MAQQTINIGATADDGTGDTFRSAFDKVNDNFNETFPLAENALSKTSLAVQTVLGEVNYTGGLKVDGNLVTSASNVLIINSEADFPTQDASTITLAANTLFFIGTPFSTAKTFTVNEAVTIASINQAVTAITYTGSGSMFNSSGANWGLRNIGYSCVNGTIFTCSGAGKTLTLENALCFGAANFGTLTNIDVIFRTSGVFSITGQGMLMSGAINIFSIDKFHLDGTSASFAAIDLGTATFADLEINDLEASGIAGSVAIKGAESSANIDANKIATVTNSTLNGDAIAPLSGVTNSDKRWSFRANSGLGDTIEDALISLNSNASETVISASSTPVKVIGTWVCERQSIFTCDTTGRATFIGERDTVIPVDITTSISAVSGTNKDIKIYLALNGSIITNSGSKNKVGASDPRNTSVIWQLELSENDFLEVFIENNSDSINLIVEDAVLRVR